MIDKLDIASKNWADDYMTQFGRRFNNMLRDAFIAGFKKGVALSKQIVRCGECKHYLDTERVKERCALKDCAVYKDDFCSYGERKDGKE